MKKTAPRLAGRRAVVRAGYVHTYPISRKARRGEGRAGDHAGTTIYDGRYATGGFFFLLFLSFFLSFFLPFFLPFLPYIPAGVQGANTGRAGFVVYLSIYLRMYLLNLLTYVGAASRPLAGAGRGGGLGQFFFSFLFFSAGGGRGVYPSHRPCLRWIGGREAVCLWLREPRGKEGEG